MPVLDTMTVNITGNASGLSSSLNDAQRSVSGFADGVSKSVSGSGKAAFSNLDNEVCSTTEKTTSKWGTVLKTGLSSALQIGGTAVAKTAGAVTGWVTDSMLNAVSGGIKRTDVMNNFSKIMSNMQISSEDSEAAIQLLSDRLDGLPTPIDQAATSVEQFTAKNKDVGYSTDMFLALNDALLAGGQSSEVQERAIQQLTEAYAAGYMDTYAWNDLMQAMPGQMDQVAGAFGMTTDELKDALQNGQLSMDDFMGKMIELDQAGANGFDSFEQQARDATGGIETQMERLQTAWERQWQKIFDAVGEDRIVGIFQTLIDWIDKAGDWVAENIEPMMDIFDQLWEIVQKVAEIFGQWIDSLFGSKGEMDEATNTLDSVRNMLDQVSEALDWVSRNMEWLGPMITVLVGGFTGLKMVDTLLAPLGGLSGALDGVELSFKGLNTTMKANVFIMIISLVFQLVMYIIELWNTNEDFRNFFIGIWEGIKSFFETVVGAIAGFFTETLPNAIQWLVGKIQWLWEKVCEFFGAIADFIGGIVDSIKRFFTETIPGAVEWLVGKIQWLWEKVCEFFQLIVDFVWGVVESIKTFFTETIPETFEKVVNFFKELPGRVAEELQNLLEKVKEFFGKIWDKIKEVASDIWDKVVETFQNIVDHIKGLGTKIKEGVKKAFDKAIDWIKGLPEKAIEWGKDMIQGFIDGIKEMFGKIGEAVSGIGDTIKGFLGFSEPDEGPLSNFHTFAPDMMKLLASGIEGGEPLIEGAVEDTASSMGEAFAACAGGAGEWGADSVREYAEGMLRNRILVERASSALAAKLKSTVGFSVPDEGPLSDFESYAPDMMALYAKGIEDNVPLVEAAAMDAADAVADAMGLAPGGMYEVADALAAEFAPLAERAESWGAAMMEALVTGIALMIPMVVAEIQAVSKAIESEMGFSVSRGRLLGDFRRSLTAGTVDWTAMAAYNVPRPDYAYAGESVQTVNNYTVYVDGIQLEGGESDEVREFAEKMVRLAGA